MRPERDRRRAPRVRARADAGYEDAQRQVFLPVHDVSQHGIFLRAEDPPAPGSHVRVLLELPGQAELLRLPGVVARMQDASPRGFAVEFDERAISDGARGALRRFVERAGLAQ